MKNPIITLVIMVLLITSSSLYAKRTHHEEWYRDLWCQAQGGKAEVQMPDKTRCDCLTETYAIEVDFGNKWYEAVGQSTHYSVQTGKRSGIVLILESRDDRKYWEKLRNVINTFKLPIDVWTIGDGTDSAKTFLKGWENNKNKAESSPNCHKENTLNIKRHENAAKWIIQIPCLTDVSGTFNGKTLRMILESKQLEGELLFSITEYGFVEK
ncbi:hypothetical protein [Candidatus Parabeggiatoa sp. HSG14]|uniref:hypothetical protein n=1 Tax=Candidatus Parabeggiatoa sp. HSG14 TaxID=3055593 RepID=UPI0025A69A01|nr:hypothetical protein [Thiotrichales bacterium HSG14]